jgi:UDP-N-acetylglucosamine--dolichyl-phosphate N-acetylglucosaminephosphotransferase
VVLALIGIVIATQISLYLQPEIIKRMTLSNHLGIDINKPTKPKIAEMGGIAIVLSVSLTLTFLGGILVFFDIYEDPTIVYAALAVVFVASYIGLFDDIAVIRRRDKAVGLILAGLPLAVSRTIDPLIIIPFYGDTVFGDFQWQYFLFWLIVVPIGIFAAANAFNMSAGYNGLESGQTSIISLFLLILAIISNKSLMGILIFASTLGASTVLYRYNAYPAKTFVGDVGTVSMGALIAVGAIFTGLEIYAVICIIPMFFELWATGYYKYKKVERRWACHSPIILKDGRLKPPKGSEKYTLFFYLLSKKPMTEKELVNKVLKYYIITGCVALSIYALGYLYCCL